MKYDVDQSEKKRTFMIVGEQEYATEGASD